MIVVGMSGGVDSSVSALLLSNKSTPIKGVFMHNWEEDGGECRADEDRKDALLICSRLLIPFSTRNFSSQYMENVFKEFLDGYKNGFTPNPDILCNREVKFKVFLNDAISMGASHIATGHYVQKEQMGNSFALLRGVDKTKDQSYFLHAITQEALQRSIFPIGHLPKEKVRAIAMENNLVTASKRDSTGICFIGQKDFKSFLSSYLPAKKGLITTVDGKAVGEHQGALYYTQGQRAPVGGVKGHSDAPWFILEKNVEENILIVGQGKDHPLLNPSTIQARDVSWINKTPPSSSFTCQVQVRHLGQAIDADVKVLDDGKVNISLSTPHFAPAKGQSAVFYDGDICLGGGPIV